jgi:hypothetical protein
LSGEARASHESTQYKNKIKIEMSGEIDKEKVHLKASGKCQNQL